MGQKIYYLLFIIYNLMLAKIKLYQHFILLFFTHFVKSFAHNIDKSHIDKNI